MIWKCAAIITGGCVGWNGVVAARAWWTGEPLAGHILMSLALYAFFVMGWGLATAFSGSDE